MTVGDITLRDGGTISCQSIRQWRTYGGLLEGLPTRQMNERNIMQLLKEEQERRWGDVPYLVPPVIRPIEYDADRKYLFGDPEALPDVTCVAWYQAYPRTLTIIWFQDQFAFPIDPSVLEHLRDLDWERWSTPGED
jgi:hypothetical protein